MSETILPDDSGFFVMEIPDEPPRPTLTILRFITPDGFGPQHLQQLRRLEEYSWDGLTARDIALRIATGDLWLWEVGDDEEHAVVVTSLIVTQGQRVLWIDGAAGNGILAKARDIVSDLSLIASFYDCIAIRAASEREGFDSLPDKLGFACVSTIWELEIGHGGWIDTGPHDTERDADDDAVVGGAGSPAGPVHAGGDSPG